MELSAEPPFRHFSSFRLFSAALCVYFDRRRRRRREKCCLRSAPNATTAAAANDCSLHAMCTTTIQQTFFPFRWIVSAFYYSPVVNESNNIGHKMLHKVVLDSNPLILT